MTPHQILTACIRLVALVWLLYTISHLYELFAYTSDSSVVQMNKTIALAFALLQVCISVALWLLPRTIAALLLPGRNVADEVAPASHLGWQTLGVVLLGVWTLSKAIPDAVYWITYYNVLATSTGRGLANFNPEQKAAMISTVADWA